MKGQGGAAERMERGAGPWRPAPPLLRFSHRRDSCGDTPPPGRRAGHASASARGAGPSSGSYPLLSRPISFPVLGPKGQDSLPTSCPLLSQAHCLQACPCSSQSTPALLTAYRPASLITRVHGSGSGCGPPSPRLCAALSADAGPLPARAPRVQTLACPCVPVLRGSAEGPRPLKPQRGAAWPAGTSPEPWPGSDIPAPSSHLVSHQLVGCKVPVPGGVQS